MRGPSKPGLAKKILSSVVDIHWALFALQFSVLTHHARLRILDIFENLARFGDAGQKASALFNVEGSDEALICGRTGVSGKVGSGAELGDKGLGDRGGYARQQCLPGRTLAPRLLHEAGL